MGDGYALENNIMQYLCGRIFFFFFFLDDGERTKECRKETEGEGPYMLPSDVRVANVTFGDFETGACFGIALV